MEQRKTEMSFEALPAEAIESLLACKEVFDVLKTLHEKYGDRIVSNDMRKTQECTRDIMASKRMCISVLGQHNSGKSTFINALLGDEFLPMSVVIETCVRVDVQHDSSIHRGMCSESCSSQKKKCPWLEVGKNVVAVGASNIYYSLGEMNKNSTAYSKETIILKVNIPLLPDEAPNGWQLSLVDNPGLGDAREDVAQLACASVLSSSVYIYLLDLCNVGGEMSVKFFQDLNKKDAGAIKEGRLIVGITKFDKCSKRRSESTRQVSVTEEFVKSKVQENACQATPNFQMCGDNIIPVSGKWALAASKLTKSAIDQESVDKSRLEYAQKMLEKCPDIDLLGGQDQTQRDLILKLDPKEVSRLLQKSSGFNELKERLKCVGKTCFHLWKAKVYSQCEKLLRDAIDNINHICEETQKSCNQKDDELKASTNSLEQITKNKQTLAATASSGSEEAKPILTTFEKHYSQDVEKLPSQMSGKQRTLLLVNEFKEECKLKIASHQFDQAQFERCLQNFLDKCEAVLSQEIYTGCSFPTVFRYQSFLNEKVTENVEFLSAAAREALHVSSLNSNESAKKDLLYSLYNPETQLHPSAIKLSSSGPSLECVRSDVLSTLHVLQLDDLEVDEHRAKPPNLDQIRQKRSILQFSVIERIRTFFRTKSVFKHFFKEQAIEKQTEESSEVDPKLTCDYEKWSDDFEKTVADMETLINEAHSEYLDDIKLDVVKHFYEEYSAKACESLKKIEEYSEQLSEKVAQLAREITDLNTEIKQMSQYRKEITLLSHKLCPVQLPTLN